MMRAKSQEVLRSADVRDGFKALWSRHESSSVATDVPAPGPRGPGLRLRDVLHEDADAAGLDVDSLTDNRADAFVLHPTQLHLNELTFLVNRLQLDDGAGSADV